LSTAFDTCRSDSLIDVTDAVATPSVTLPLQAIVFPFALTFTAAGSAKVVSGNAATAGMSPLCAAWDQLFLSFGAIFAFAVIEHDTLPDVTCSIVAGLAPAVLVVKTAAPPTASATEHAAIVPLPSIPVPPMSVRVPHDMRAPESACTSKPIVLAGLLPPPGP
jgi:hypothetical protein